jgi:hypothetical protein
MSTPYKKSDFKVGQEVVLGRDSSNGNYWRGKLNVSHVEDVVLKVGTKYILTRRGKFEIDKSRGEMRDTSNDGLGLYPSMKDWETSERRRLLVDGITSISKKKLEEIGDVELMLVADMLGVKYEVR